MSTMFIDFDWMGWIEKFYIFKTWLNVSLCMQSSYQISAKSTFDPNILSEISHLKKSCILENFDFKYAGPRDGTENKN